MFPRPGYRPQPGFGRQYRSEETLCLEATPKRLPYRALYGHSETPGRRLLWFDGYSALHLALPRRCTETSAVLMLTERTAVLMLTERTAVLMLIVYQRR